MNPEYIVNNRIILADDRSTSYDHRIRATLGNLKYDLLTINSTKISNYLLVV